MTWTATAVVPLLLTVVPAQQEKTPSTTPAAEPSSTAASTARSGTADVVELVDGEKLEGKLLTVTDKFVEMDLGSGTLVGFPRKRVAKIRRGVGVVAASTSPKGRTVAEDQWFLVHDGDGESVGWLHSNVIEVAANGHIELSEEWEFRHKDGRTAVTMQEIVGPDGPISCYYRERSFAPGANRVASERIIEARVDGESLHVHRLNGRLRDSRRYRLPAQASFPLAARFDMRRTGSHAGDGLIRTVYDPAQEQFVAQTFFPGRRRRVAVAGEETEVIEVQREANSVVNTEWLDQKLNVVRREIRGPGLVAVPASEQGARDLAGADRPVRPAPLRMEPGGAFGLWLPNPAWAFVDSETAGRLDIRCGTHDATVRCILLPDIEADPTLDSATDTVERWYSLLHTGFKVENRMQVTLRGRRAQRIEGRVREGRTVRRSTVHVLPLRGAVLAVTWDMPLENERLLQDDLDKILQRIELK